jgi:hypothetical protein
MRQFINVLIVTVFISSCGIQKNMLETRQALDDIQQLQEKENLQLTAIAGTADARLNEGKIDANVKERVTAKLDRFLAMNDSAKKDAARIDTLLEDKKSFRKNYKTMVVPLLDSLKKNGSKYAERLTLYMMIQEGLNIADYHLFDLAAFFGSGKYIIPDDKTDLALASFAPIIDSVVVFSNKYDTIPKTATLIILGFADGAGFATEGPLYDTLITLIGKTQVTKEELNLKLSELRAQELIKQLTKVFLQKASLFRDIDKTKIEYIGQGKGEAYPLPTIKNYEVDDARRRIVLCYWSVLPD